MSTCETCSRWTKRDTHKWGSCGLKLPRWVGEAPSNWDRATAADDTCSFHDQVEMEGDAEAIHGWGGQGA